jgi:hypothetical protein
MTPVFATLVALCCLQVAIALRGLAMLAEFIQRTEHTDETSTD